jgi:hypothetical protein
MNRQNKDWTLLEPCQEDQNFQIIPNNDSRRHEKVGTVCWCEPQIFFENGKRIVSHYAKDLRSNPQEE